MVFVIDSIDEGIAHCELSDDRSFSVPAALLGKVCEGDCMRAIPGGDITVVSISDEYMTVKCGGIYTALPLCLDEGVSAGDAISFIKDTSETEARKKIIRTLSEDLFE